MERESVYFWRKERGGQLGKVENRFEYLEDRVSNALLPGMFRHSDARRRRLYTSGLLARGRRGTGVVRHAEELDMVAPGTDDPGCILTLEVHAPRSRNRGRSATGSGSRAGHSP